MSRLLFLIFVIVPFIEITVLMQVGAVLGVLPTLAIIVITAYLGAQKVKQQGMATMANIQQKMAVGEMPSDDIIAGMLLLVAGVLLITPGFITDAFGLLLLFPTTRNALINLVKNNIISPRVSTFNYSQNAEYQQHKPNNHIIEGEFERKE